MAGDKTVLYVGIGAAIYLLFFNGSGSAAPSGGGISGGLSGDGGVLSGGGGQSFQGGGTSGTASTTAGSTSGSNPLPNADGSTTRDHRVRAGNNQSVINAPKNPTDPNNSNGFFRDATGQPQRQPSNPSARVPRGPATVPPNSINAATLQSRVDNATGHKTYLAPQGASVIVPKKSAPAVGNVGFRITQTTSGKFTGATQANGNYVAATPVGNGGTVIKPNIRVNSQYENHIAPRTISRVR